jgi:hypothetical protein
MAFTELSTTRRRVDLRPSTTEGLRRVQNLKVNRVAADPGWRVAPPPPGFALRGGAAWATRCSCSTATAWRACRCTSSRSRRRAAAARTRIRRGAVNVHTRFGNGRRIVAIGKVPAATVTYFARHVVPAEGTLAGTPAARMSGTKPAAETQRRHPIHRNESAWPTMKTSSRFAVLFSSTALAALVYAQMHETAGARLLPPTVQAAVAQAVSPTVNSPPLVNLPDFSRLVEKRRPRRRQRRGGDRQGKVHAHAQVDEDEGEDEDSQAPARKRCRRSSSASSASRACPARCRSSRAAAPPSVPASSSPPTATCSPTTTWSTARAK